MAKSVQCHTLSLKRLQELHLSEVALQIIPHAINFQYTRPWLKQMELYSTSEQFPYRTTDTIQTLRKLITKEFRPEPTLAFTETQWLQLFPKQMPNS